MRRISMRLGIKAKLLVLVLVACLLPLLASVVALQVIGYRERVRERQLVLENEAVHVAMNLRVAFEREVGNLAERFANPEFVSLVGVLTAGRSSETSAQFHARMLEIDGRWTTASPDDSLVHGVLTNAVAERLRAFKAAQPLYAELLVTDAAGELVASSEKTSDYFQADEEWWLRAVKVPRRRAWVEGPHWDESARVFSLDICFPLWSHQGSGRQLVGVVKGVLNSNPMFGSVPFVLSTEGVVREMVRADGKVVLRLEDESVLRRDEFLAGQAVQRMQKVGTGSLMERDAEGVLQMVGYAPVQLVGILPRAANDASRAELFVVVHQPASATLGALRLQTAWMTVAGVLVSVAFAGVGLYLGHRNFILPLRTLREGAHAVAAAARTGSAGGARQVGDASHVEAVARIRTGDEIESLAEDFRVMAERVMDYHRELQREIERKTAEILRKTDELEGDLATAREFQRAFLPQSYPSVPADGVGDAISLRFHHVYQPASTLGGDFFDVIKLGEHQAGVLVADVMGHGTRSALVTAMLRTLVLELAAVGADPGVFLEQLNQRFGGVLGAVGESVFATAFYLVADTQACEVRFATAGHPSPLLGKRDSGMVTALVGRVTGNPALGLFPEARYAVHRRSLVAGDVCVLYTDGVVEALNEREEEYGRERLVTALQRHLQADAAELSAALVADLRGFGGGQPLNDDVCLVVMEVVGNPRAAVAGGEEGIRVAGAGLA